MSRRSDAIAAPVLSRAGRPTGTARGLRGYGQRYGVDRRFISANPASSRILQAFGVAVGDLPQPRSSTGSTLRTPTAERAIVKFPDQNPITPDATDD